MAKRTRRSTPSQSVPHLLLADPASLYAARRDHMPARLYPLVAS